MIRQGSNIQAELEIDARVRCWHEQVTMLGVLLVLFSLELDKEV
jgi:hypothetical protein